MTLILHPRAAPGRELRVWVGAPDRTSAPALTWELDGAPAAPAALRPMTSARSPEMLGDPDEGRVFAGVFGFEGDDVRPGSRHTVAVRDDSGDSAEIGVRTLTDRVPPPGEGRFNVLLASCFHRLEDRPGFAGHVVAGLPTPYRPDLTVLMGDQVYLDLPTISNFEDETPWLARKFERDYLDNWAGPLGYGQVVGSAPSVSLPDDHEYWNNYPARSPFIQNTWRASGRDRWERAARAMYEAFQLPWPEGFDEALVLDVDPLSFFFLDTRTHRAEDRSESTPARLRDQLEDWVDRVVSERRTAIVTTGQSFLDEERGRLSGSVGDWTLASYGDYEAILRILDRVPRAGLHLLLLTGDVHWGRVLSGWDWTSGRRLVHEVISSPSSLVSTVGRDQLASLGAAIAGVFGRRREWPRHGDPGEPPAFIGHRVLPRPYGTSVLHRQKGNQVAVLSFHRAGFGVDAEIRYWPIERRRAAPREAFAGTLRLTSA